MLHFCFRAKKAKTADAEAITEAKQAIPEPPGPSDASAEAVANGDAPPAAEAEAKPKKKRTPKVKWPIGKLCS